MFRQLPAARSCKGKQEREIRGAAQRRGAAGGLPAVTAKPAIVRMPVCHGGVALLAVSGISCLPLNREAFLLDLRGFLFPSLFKASLPLLPVPPPTHFSVGRLYVRKSYVLRTVAFAKVTSTVSVQLMKVSLAVLTPK